MLKKFSVPKKRTENFAASKLESEKVLSSKKKRTENFASSKLEAEKVLSSKKKNWELCSVKVGSWKSSQFQKKELRTLRRQSWNLKKFCVPKKKNWELCSIKVGSWKSSQFKKKNWELHGIKVASCKNSQFQNKIENTFPEKQFAIPGKSLQFHEKKFTIPKNSLSSKKKELRALSAFFPKVLRKLLMHFQPKTLLFECFYYVWLLQFYIVVRRKKCQNHIFLAENNTLAYVQLWKKALRALSSFFLELREIFGNCKLFHGIVNFFQGLYFFQ